VVEIEGVEVGVARNRKLEVGGAGVSVGATWVPVGPAAQEVGVWVSEVKGRLRVGEERGLGEAKREREKRDVRLEEYVGESVWIKFVVVGKRLALPPAVD